MSNAYYAVKQDSSKAVFRHSLVYKNTMAWTDQHGIHHPAECKSLTPDGMGIYTAFNIEEEDGKLAKKVMDDFVKEGKKPIIGPYSTREAAVVAERKLRPKTKDEIIAELKYKLEQADAQKSQGKDKVI
jgi:hypothetical protein